jgi:hypothetical protein
MTVRPSLLGSLPFLNFWERDIEPKWHELAQRVTTLAPREFMVFKRGETLPIKLRSYSMPDPQASPDVLALRQQMIDTSGRNFASSKDDLLRQVEAHMTEVALGFGTDYGEFRPEDGDFWEEG